MNLGSNNKSEFTWVLAKFWFLTWILMLRFVNQSVDGTSWYCDGLIELGVVSLSMHKLDSYLMVVFYVVMEHLCRGKF